MDDVLNTNADEMASRRHDTLTYHGSAYCRDCPDEVARDPSVAIILPASASTHAALHPEDRVFVRAADGIVELLAAEQYGTYF